METIGEFYDKDADVLTGSDEELKKVVGGFWEIFVEILHVATGFAEFSDAINEEGNIFAELFLDVFKSEVSILYGVMKNAGNDRIFIHIPLFENLHDGEWVDNIRLPSFAQLALMCLGGDSDGFLNARGFTHTIIIA